MTLDVLLFLLLVLPAPVQAQFSFTTNNGTITITNYTGPGGAVIIPNTITGLPVAGIGDYAFASRTNVTSVTIPNSVIIIGDCAFWGCGSLTGVTIPDSVTSIGESAFSLCASLSSVAIDNSVTNIGAWAFNGCTSLTSVTIPNGVENIGDGAFWGCTGLTGVTIPDSVTSIGDGAFPGCTNLTAIVVDALNSAYSSLDGILFNKSQTVLIQCPAGKAGTYAIPSSVTNIGDGAFWGCTGLTGVTILDSVTSIGDGAFQGCTSLTGVAIPDSVTRFGHGAFSDCAGLTSVAIGNRVTNIGAWAFSGCSGLTNLTIPNSVTSIGSEAFWGCSNLTIVLIPRPQSVAHPLVEDMLRDIQPADLYNMMRQITGEEPVFVGNEVVVITNRRTGSAPLRKATQFASDQLQALGLQVHYQDWERAWQSEPTYSDRNIVGIQPGVSRPEDIVVICAHFDDYGGPGADDNASGSAAVLTAARTFSQCRFERTIHYVLFTGEEQHGLGSQEYVAQAVAGGSNIVAVLAPDMIGYASSALVPPTCSLTTWFVPSLGLEGASGSEIEAMFTVGFEVEAMFTNVVAMYGLSNTLSCTFEHPGLFGVPSDAEFFFEKGYSTLLLTHAHENPRIHSDRDTLDTLNLSYFTAMVQAIVGTAAHLAHPISGQPPGQPVLGPVVLLPTGAVQVALTGVAGRTYSIQASTDLTNWLTITNVALTDPPGQFVDSAAAAFPQRFYRAVVP